MRQRAIVAMATAAFLALLLPATTEGQRGQQVTLPDGPGKAMVEATCAKCHGLNLIPNSFGFNRDEWARLFGTMVALPKDQADTIAGYLATHFPEKPNVKANIIAGPVQVTFKEWVAPTLGQRPHDPLPANDGSLWWTGQYASRLGRVDPRTGAMKEFPLDTPNSGPHGLDEDADGNIWYTGINVHEIGKVDPKTGAVTEYKVPEPARNPHTPIINDKTGMLFFTTQSGHVGRLNTRTGEFRIGKTPTDGTYPYGIQLNSQGVPWYVDYRGNRVGSVDPVTMEIKEYPLPNPDARPRRITITPDDAVWYTDFPRGYLGRFDPKTGQVKEWLSPSGKDSRPYGIAAVGDVIWYNESGVKPNTLVRFDTKTERFQTFAIPSGGHVVRHMVASRDGNLALANSGINMIALAEVRNGRSTAAR